MELDTLSLLNAVFESTVEGILIVDNSGKIAKCNSRFLQMWGIPNEVLATNDDDKLIAFITDQLLHPNEFLKKVTELYRNPEALSHDNIAFKDGRFFARFSRPLKLGGETRGRVWSFRDITDYNKSFELMSAITELSPDMISIVNSAFEIVYASSASLRIHGYNPAELLGKKIFDLIHEVDRERARQRFDELLNSRESTASVQYRYRNKYGSWSWVESHASNQLDNPFIRGIVMISREINERKKLEDDLGHALKVRDEFISIVSHELKTPITGMKLQLQLIQRARDRDQGYLPRPETFETLLDQVNLLQHLIDDLLCVSRIRTGKFVINLVGESLSSLVEQTCRRFHDLLQEAGCRETVSITPNVFVYCDRFRIDQVVSNLISNVIRHAAGARVEISLEKTSVQAVLKIRDYGRGIPKEKQESIFGLFERATSDYVSGIGVGLYLSRSIVEQHRGTLTVESDGVTGTTFIVALPLAARGLE